MNKCELVRQSCKKVVEQSEHVTINQQALEQFAEKLSQEFKNGYKYTEFGDYDCHFSGDEELLVDYLFVLDSLNFCFWPEGANKWEYDNLALSLKNVLKEDPLAFKPKNLAVMTKDFVQNKIFQGLNFPLMDERVRILNEVGLITVSEFDGSFVNILNKANKSAVKLLYILTSFFNNFQDVAIYKGRQVCFYKRSQIFIGDLYSSFQGKKYGQFDDISELTMFPDYRVPQILNQEGIMVYSEDLTQKINKFEEIPHGCNYEIEIRAATIEAVEQLKKLLQQKGHQIITIEIDWILWQKGEESKDKIVPHHRVLSIFY